MTIYIDTLIFTNVIIDYILLIITGDILKINYKHYRIVLSSIFGGITSLIILLPSLNFLFNTLIQIIICCTIILLAFGFKSIKCFVKRIFIFFLITTCFTGIIFFLISKIKTNFISINNNIVYFNISPILLIVLTSIAYLILSFIGKIKIDKRNLVHKISFVFQGKEYKFISRYDTCCNIKEPFSGGEVILVEKNLLDKIIVPDGYYRIIPFNSLGGEGIIKGFRPEELYIDNVKITQTVYIGITEGVFKDEIGSVFNYKNICE